MIFCMAQEGADVQESGVLPAIETRRRLAYPAIAITLSFLIPGLVLLLYLLSWGWDIRAPPYSYDYYIDFTWYLFWTPLATVLIVAGVACASAFTILWFRKPRWNVNLVTIFSWFGILFGTGLSIWAFLFAFVIPTGAFFWDGVNGGGSGLLYAPPTPLLISLPILAAGIYGQRVTSWIRKHPSLAYPPDLRDRPNHLSRAAWIRSGAVIIVALALVFGVFLNPALSPAPYIHDRDGDGIADMLDRFPDDPALWEPMGFWIKVTESPEYFNLTLLDVSNDNPAPIADFYLSVSHKSGSVEIDKMPVDEMDSGVSYNGVRFYDATPTGYFQEGDALVFDRAVYEVYSVVLLSDHRGDVAYLRFPLQPTA
jgi:hypothetical protein